jgi:hypothetical protein
MTGTNAARPSDAAAWPAVTFAARAVGDRRTHVVVAPAGAVAEPAAHGTCCGLPAAELHPRPRDVSCDACAAVSGVRTAADFPPERVT